EGLEIIASGRVSTYSGRSSYQIIIEQVEVAGEGALLKLLEDRRKKLLKEGLFDQSNKLPLPKLPNSIGVVTSPTGSVIRDILHRLRDRFPRRVLIWPTRVQGKDAAKEIVAALEGFDKLSANSQIEPPELIIVARGGGSLEDLWAFNEENVVRAVSRCSIPIISAIGHETDTTLIDLVADLRAPTPTAAAEFAVPEREELLGKVKNSEIRLRSSIKTNIESMEEKIMGLSRGIVNPMRVLENAYQKFDDTSSHMQLAIGNNIQEKSMSLGQLSAALVSPRQQILFKDEQLKMTIKTLTNTFREIVVGKHNKLEKTGLALEGVSFQRTLDRGFALVTDSEGNLTSAKKTSLDSIINIKFSDGLVSAQVYDKTETES
ncbi:MAG: exodeoxyribonuclease VII large subunit, partial [Rhodospirillaceae bacterium]|nr:exodeoxyribonuclease VII large subunit [Rhodospirillaceae bacterium]